MVATDDKLKTALEGAGAKGLKVWDRSCPSLHSAPRSGYAPGGGEAMAAIGLALGYDPAFVAIHHFARIVMLVFLVPFVLKRIR